MNRRMKRQVFGEWLKKQRERAQLTQSDLAVRLNYDNPQIISNIERGVSALPYRRLSDFSNALRCDAVELELQMLSAEAQSDETVKTLGIVIKNLSLLKKMEETSETFVAPIKTKEASL